MWCVGNILNILAGVVYWCNVVWVIPCDILTMIVVAVKWF